MGATSGRERTRNGLKHKWRLTGQTSYIKQPQEPRSPCVDPSSLFTHGAKAAQYECSAAAAVAGWHALPLRGSLHRRNATTASGIWDWEDH